MTPSSGLKTRFVEGYAMTSDSASLLDEARDRFKKADIPFPPVPAGEGGTWRQSGMDVLTTRTLDFPMSLYDLDAYMKEFRDGNVQDYVTLGFAGHGFASEALHFYAVRGPVAVFLQLKCGTAEAPLERDRIEGVFTLTEELLASASDAAKDGGFRPGQRMIVKISDYSGSESGWGWTGQPDSWQSDGDFALLGAITALKELGSQA